VSPRHRVVQQRHSRLAIRKRDRAAEVVVPQRTAVGAANGQRVAEAGQRASRVDLLTVRGRGE
jgi:hypothetical protein